MVSEVNNYDVSIDYEVEDRPLTSKAFRRRISYHSWLLLL